MGVDLWGDTPPDYGWCDTGDPEASPGSSPRLSPGQVGLVSVHSWGAPGGGWAEEAPPSTLERLFADPTTRALARTHLPRLVPKGHAKKLRGVLWPVLTIMLRGTGLTASHTALKEAVCQVLGEPNHPPDHELQRTQKRAVQEAVRQITNALGVIKGTIAEAKVRLFLHKLYFRLLGLEQDLRGICGTRLRHIVTRDLLALKDRGASGVDKARLQEYLIGVVAVWVGRRAAPPLREGELAAHAAQLLRAFQLVREWCCPTLKPPTLGLSPRPLRDPACHEPPGGLFDPFRPEGAPADAPEGTPAAAEEGPLPAAASADGLFYDEPGGEDAGAAALSGGDGMWGASQSTEAAPPPSKPGRSPKVSPRSVRSLRTVRSAQGKQSAHVRFEPTYHYQLDPEHPEYVPPPSAPLPQVPKVMRRKGNDIGTLHIHPDRVTQVLCGAAPAATRRVRSARAGARACEAPLQPSSRVPRRPLTARHAVSVLDVRAEGGRGAKYGCFPPPPGREADKKVVEKVLAERSLAEAAEEQQQVEAHALPPGAVLSVDAPTFDWERINAVPTLSADLGVGRDLMLLRGKAGDAKRVHRAKLRAGAAYQRLCAATKPMWEELSSFVEAATRVGGDARELPPYIARSMDAVLEPSADEVWEEPSAAAAAAPLARPDILSDYPELFDVPGEAFLPGGPRRALLDPKPDPPFPFEPVPPPGLGPRARALACLPPQERPALPTFLDDDAEGPYSSLCVSSAGNSPQRRTERSASTLSMPA